MGSKLRVVHYLNQFFGGLGGEEKASEGPRVVEEAVGPGRAIGGALGERGEIVATVICGDNYIGEKTEEVAAEITELIAAHKPDIFIAGPAFEAGRYGVACGAVCKAVQEKLGISAVTGMYDENPGVDLYHKDVYIIQTGDSVRGMNDAVSRMVKLALKLNNGEKIGRPTEDGYFPRGILVNEPTGRSGAERAVAMLLAKLKGEPFETEVVQPRHSAVSPAAPLEDIQTARIVLITDGGVIRMGNPDGIEASNATKFGTFSAEGKEALSPEEFDVNHGGYYTAFTKENPNRLVPVDAMRDLEKDHAIGKLHETFYTTAGVATRAENAKKFAQAIAREIKESGVVGAILTST